MIQAALCSNAYVGLEGHEGSATEEDIKRDFHKQAKLNHPDRVKPDYKARAEKAFQKLSTAYQVLKCRKQRAEYDRTSMY